jgi:hypothetical protein
MDSGEVLARFEVERQALRLGTTEGCVPSSVWRHNASVDGPRTSYLEYRPKASQISQFGGSSPSSRFTTASLCFMSGLRRWVQPRPPEGIIHRRSQAVEHSRHITRDRALAEESLISASAKATTLESTRDRARSTAQLGSPIGTLESMSRRAGRKLTTPDVDTLRRCVIRWEVLLYRLLTRHAAIRTARPLRQKRSRRSAEHNDSTRWNPARPSTRDSEP